MPTAQSSQLHFATTTFGTDFIASGSVIQPDGKVLVTGSSSSVVIVARFDRAGNLDTGFGTGGIVKLTVSDQSYDRYDHYGGPLAVASDGRIIASAAIYTGHAISYFELSPDGKAAKEMPATGKVLLGDGTFTSHPGISATGAFQQADGKVINAAGLGGDSFSLMRYNPDGSIDTSFGKSGEVSGSGLGGVPIKMVQQPDGKILVHLQDNEGVVRGGLIFARYTVNGELDTTFGDGGVLKSVPGSRNEIFQSVAVQADGKIVAVSLAMTVVRYLSNGQLDTTFSGDGIVTALDFGRSAYGYTNSGMGLSVNVQPDGKILVAGTIQRMNSMTGGGRDPMVVRFNTDGSVDSTYGEPYYNITGTSGDDTLEIFGGETNYIDGGNGVDTFALRGLSEYWSIVEEPEGWQVVSTNGNIRISLANIEYVKFGYGTPFPETVALNKSPGSPDSGAVNRISVSPEASEINGTAGKDVAVYAGKLSDFTIKSTAAGFTVSGPATGSDTLRNIERLEFEDKTVNLGIKGAASSIAATDLKTLQELYIAFFNRIPDADGLEYWIGQFKSGMTLKQIAESFYNAGVQYSSLTGFSANMTDSDFVNVVYKNVLGRQDGADATGLAYWTGALASGAESKGSLVSTILSSAHTFKGDPTWGRVADLLDNKAAVADKFAVQYGLNYNTSEASISEGMKIAAAVTAADFQAAIALIGVTDAQLSI